MHSQSWTVFINTVSLCRLFTKSDESSLCTYPSIVLYAATTADVLCITNTGHRKRKGNVKGKFILTDRYWERAWVTKPQQYDPSVETIAQ